MAETLLQFDTDGSLVARTKVGDAGADLTVDGRDVWLRYGRSLAHWMLLQPAP